MTLHHIFTEKEYEELNEKAYVEGVKDGRRCAEDEILISLESLINRVPPRHILQLVFENISEARQGDENNKRLITVELNREEIEGIHAFLQKDIADRRAKHMKKG